MKRALMALFCSFALAHGIGMAADSVGPLAGSPRAMAVDAQGNLYIAGNFSTSFFAVQTIDFDTGAGVDNRTESFCSLFVTKYNTDGSYAWTQSGSASGFAQGDITGLVVVGSTVYVSGFFNTANLVFGTPATTVTFTSGRDAFIFALKTSDGTFENSFSGDGVLPVNGTGDQSINGLSANGTSLYACGHFNAANPVVGGVTLTQALIGTQDAFVLAFDNTGARITTFAGDGLQTFGGGIGGGAFTGTSSGNAITVVPSFTGGVYVAGSFNAQNAGIGGTGTNTSAGLNDVFVMGLGFDGLPLTTILSVFTADSVVTFGGSFDDTPRTIIPGPGGNGLFVMGEFSSTNAGFNGPGTTSIVGGLSDVFVLTLTTGTQGGLPRSEFSLDGVQVFGGSREESGTAIISTASTLFITGQTLSINAGIGGTGSAVQTGSGDAYIIALSPATGEAVTTFHEDGILTYGGLSSDIGRAMAIRGSRLLLAGEQASGQAGFEGPGTTSVSPYKRFLADLDAAGDELNNAPIVQGSILHVTLDADGNTFIAGEFTEIADYNPQNGADIKSARGGDVFITRFSAGGRYDWTQTFGSSQLDKVGGLAVANGKVYAVGRYQGDTAGIGGSGTLPQPPTGAPDVFVLALDAATGTAVPTFGTNGVLVFGSDTADDAQGVVAVGANIYVCAQYIATSTIRLGGGTIVLPAKGQQDLAILALNGNTGAPVTSFGGIGAVAFGSANGEGALRLAASPDGATLYALGFNSGSTVNAGFGSATDVSIPSAARFVLSIATATGAPNLAFSADAVQTIANFNPISLSANATGVFLSGSVGTIFDTNFTIGDGTVIPVLTGLKNAVLKLNSATGATQTAFGSGGAQFIITGGAGFPTVAATSNTVYVAGEFNSATLGIGAAGTVTTAGLQDGYLAALDATTGAPTTTFSSTGIKTFGGSAYDGFLCVAQGAGNVVAAGSCTSVNAGFSGLGPFDATGWGGMVTRFDAVSGAGTRIVINTNDAGPGSLRDALKFSFEGDSVLFDASVFALDNSDAATVINALSPLPPLDKGRVTIDARDRRVTVNGTAAGSAAGLLVTSSNNTIQGLSIVGFTSSGIALRNGAKNNLIGGSRALGSGPNGQGLRIANCGAFGVEISGAGTDTNSVKGCWIGLDAAGMASIANLAGVLIQDGAQSNVIGSTLEAEMNVISGNSFEGVTISGAGTDNNEILGNIIGIAAVDTAVATGAISRDSDPFPTRATAGNGSAGAFISKGTQGSKLGGEEDGKGNTIANNGGSGLEIRTANTRRNAARKNRITRNQRGGIALFDGSNNGVTAPAFTSVVKVAATTGVLSRGKVNVVVSGTATRDGVIDLFGDDGGQGGVFVGRATSTGGVWQVEVEIDDLLNMTATLTDLEGNTSAFGGRGPALDGDKDGVSDELETLAGTDPNNASDVPVVGGGVAVDALAIGFSFTKPADKLKLEYRIIVPEGYVNSAAVVGVKLAGIAEKITLNAKGTGTANGATLKVTGAPAMATPANTGVKMSFAVSKKDLEPFFAETALTNKTTAKIGETVTVPVVVTLAAAGKINLYIGSVNVLYKATQGKTGKAAKVKVVK